MTERLDSIDQSITKINRHIFSDNNSSQSLSAISDSDDLDLFYHPPIAEDDEHEHSDLYAGEIFHKVYRKIDERGGERFYGSTAALSLFDTSRRALGDILANEGVKRNGPLADLATREPAFKTTLQTHYDSFPFHESCRETNLSGDGKSVANPPRSFLDSVIDCYLTEINAARPVFQASNLKETIDAHYLCEAADRNEARSLCFSNIIFLVLSLKSKLARWSDLPGNGMDEDLLLSFLNNSRRALQNLDRFLEPRLVNVQALVTLVSS